MFASQRTLASISQKRLFNPSLTRINNILLKIPYDFSTLTTEKINQYVEYLTKCYQMTYDGIADLSKTGKNLSFENTVQPLIDLSIIECTAMRLCCFAKEVHTDKAVRECSADASEVLDNLGITHRQREDVFLALYEYQKNAYEKEKPSLHPEEIRYFESLMRAYKRGGLMIPDPNIRNEITELKKRISECAIKFEQNLNEENTTLALTAEELRGLPADWLGNPDRQLEDGRYKVTLQYPDVFPILKYAQDQAIRKKIYLAFERRCVDDNIPLLKEILVSRQKMATLLGYSNYVDYACEPRMAKNAHTVKTFLDEMNARFDAGLDKTLNTLTEYARQHEKNPELKLELYDIGYYTRLYKEKFFDIDLDEIKKYFPLDKVLQGTLEIYQRILGLIFIPYDDKTTWHPDVLAYKVYDSQSKEFIGQFYLDLHPREGKYGHAAVYEQLVRCDISHLTGKTNDHQTPISVMLCNFPKNENIPFDDVVTFFHEFGHLVHFTCSKTKIPAMHGNHVEDDFAEAPSQMLENWCYEPAALALLSAHPETGEPLPHEIALKMKAMDTIFAGYVYKRQLVFAYFDFYVHSMSAQELENLDITDFYNNFESEMTHLPLVPGSCRPAGFSHIVGEYYDGGYYGYLYSEVYAHDMFATVFKADPLSPISGKRYRECILEPGASQDADVLMKNFLGRAPRIDAFIEHFELENERPVKRMRK